MFLYVIRKCIYRWWHAGVRVLWLTQNVNNWGMGYLLWNVICVWNLNENSIFQTVQLYHKVFAYVCHYLLFFCLCIYPQTVYCIPYSCQCQYLLKYNIYNYCNIGQISTGPMDLFFPADIVECFMKSLEDLWRTPFYRGILMPFCIEVGFNLLKIILLGIAWNV